MKIYIIIALTALVLLLGGFLGSYMVSSSLWMMWELLPVNRQSAVAFQHSNVLDGYIYDYKLSIIDLTHYEAVNRMAYSQSDSSEVMVALPTLRQQFTLRNELEKEGWAVKRLGWLLRAEKGRGHESPTDILNVSRSFTRRIFSKNLAMTPLFIIDAKQERVPLLDRDIFGVASLDSGTLDIRLAFNDSPLADMPFHAEINEANDNNSLSLYIASNSVAMLTDEQRNNLNSLLLQQLGFIHTAPRIVDLLVQHKHVFIDVDDNNQAAFGVEGRHDAFIEQMIDFVTQEETYTRPVTKAFILPDGSLGYETVPGEEKDVFTEDDSCISTVDVETRLWLCLKNNRSAISSDKRHALSVIDEDVIAHWKVDIGSKYLEMLRLKNVKKLRAIGNDDYAHLILLVE